MFLNDEWRTAGRVAWLQIEEHAPWVLQKGFATAVFRNRLWVLGGWAKPDPETVVVVNDVWYMEIAGDEPTIEGNPGWLEMGEALSLRVDLPAAWGDET